MLRWEGLLSEPVDGENIRSSVWDTLSLKTSIRHPGGDVEGSRSSRRHPGWRHTFGCCQPREYLNFFFFLAALCGTRDLSSLIRDQTRAPCSGSAES